MAIDKQASHLPASKPKIPVAPPTASAQVLAAAAKAVPSSLSGAGVNLGNLATPAQAPKEETPQTMPGGSTSLNAANNFDPNAFQGIYGQGDVQGIGTIPVGDMNLTPGIQPGIADQVLGAIPQTTPTQPSAPVSAGTPRASGTTPAPAQQTPTGEPISGQEYRGFDTPEQPIEQTYQGLPTNVSPTQGTIFGKDVGQTGTREGLQTLEDSMEADQILRRHMDEQQKFLDQYSGEQIAKMIGDGIFTDSTAINQLRVSNPEKYQQILEGFASIQASGEHMVAGEGFTAPATATGDMNIQALMHGNNPAQLNEWNMAKATIESQALQTLSYLETTPNANIIAAIKDGTSSLTAADLSNLKATNPAKYDSLIKQTAQLSANEIKEIYSPSKIQQNINKTNSFVYGGESAAYMDMAMEGSYTGMGDYGVALKKYNQTQAAIFDLDNEISALPRKAGSYFNMSVPESFYGAFIQNRTAALQGRKESLTQQLALYNDEMKRIMEYEKFQWEKHYQTQKLMQDAYQFDTKMQWDQAKFGIERNQKMTERSHKYNMDIAKLEIDYAKLMKGDMKSFTRGGISYTEISPGVVIETSDVLQGAQMAYGLSVTQGLISGANPLTNLDMQCAAGVNRVMNQFGIDFKLGTYKEDRIGQLTHFDNGKMGDIVLINSGTQAGKKYGHVGIMLEDMGDRVKVADWNFGSDEKFRISTFSKNSVDGYIDPIIAGMSKNNVEDIKWLTAANVMSGWKSIFGDNIKVQDFISPMTPAQAQNMSNRSTEQIARDAGMVAFADPNNRNFYTTFNWLMELSSRADTAGERTERNRRGRAYRQMSEGIYNGNAAAFSQLYEKAGAKAMDQYMLDSLSFVQQVAKSGKDGNMLDSAIVEQGKKMKKKVLNSLKTKEDEALYNKAEAWLNTILFTTVAILREEAGARITGPEWATYLDLYSPTARAGLESIGVKQTAMVGWLMGNMNPEMFYDPFLMAQQSTNRNALLNLK